jgi:hypothetical protein
LDKSPGSSLAEGKAVLFHLCAAVKIKKKPFCERAGGFVKKPKIFLIKDLRTKKGFFMGLQTQNKKLFQRRFRKMLKEDGASRQSIDGPEHVLWCGMLFRFLDKYNMGEGEFQ